MSWIRSFSPNPKIVLVLSYPIGVGGLIYWFFAPGVADQATSPDKHWKVSVLMTYVPGETDLLHLEAPSLQIRDNWTGRSLHVENPFGTRDNVQANHVLWSADSKRFYCLFRASDVEVPYMRSFNISQGTDPQKSIVLNDGPASISQTVYKLMASPNKSDHDLADQIKQVFPNWNGW